MKKHLPFLLLLLCCSWTPNANTWSLQLGGKTVLSSQENAMGEMARIDRKKLHDSDSLCASRYLCGALGLASHTTLFIRDENEKLLKKYEAENPGAGYFIKAPVRELLALPGFAAGKPVSLYFSIHTEMENFNDTVLLAKIRLK